MDQLWKILAAVGALATGTTVLFMIPGNGVLQVSVRFVSAIFLMAVVYNVTSSIGGRQAD